MNLPRVTQFYRRSEIYSATHGHFLCLRLVHFSGNVHVWWCCTGFMRTEIWELWLFYGNRGDLCEPEFPEINAFAGNVTYSRSLDTYANFNFYECNWKNTITMGNYFSYYTLWKALQFWHFIYFFIFCVIFISFQFQTCLKCIEIYHFALHFW